MEREKSVFECVARCGKDVFFEKIQVYINEGVLREVYCADNYCIMSYGELYYVLLPYALYEGHPFGISIKEDSIMRVILDAEKIDGLLQFHARNMVELNVPMIREFNIFSPEYLEDAQAFIEKCKILKKTNYEFEKRLRTITYDELRSEVKKSDRALFWKVLFERLAVYRFIKYKILKRKRSYFDDMISNVCGTQVLAKVLLLLRAFILIALILLAIFVYSKII